MSDSVPEITNQAISTAKIGIDCYLNNDFSTVIDPEKLLVKLLDFKRKGLKLRMISDLTMKDSSLYRDFVNYFEIRHTDQISCNRQSAESVIEVEESGVLPLPRLVGFGCPAIANDSTRADKGQDCACRTVIFATSHAESINRQTLERMTIPAVQASIAAYSGVPQ